ncbi:MAG: hypothetical protein JXQ90_06240 [Cyclobacteriaceae bacterium]
MTLKETLLQILDHLPVLSGEMCLMGGSILLLIIGMLTQHVWTIRVLAMMLLVVTFFLVGGEPGAYFSGAIIIDPFASGLKQLFLLVALSLFLFRLSNRQRLEYHFLMISVLVGSFFMLSSTHLLLIYLAIELASYSQYLLSGFAFTKHGAEGAMKYLLYGGVSSAVMLFGISLLYGASQSFYLADLPSSELTTMGLALFSVGLLFKTSVWPFHIWVPSTYQEAIADTVAFFAIVPKLAGFGLIYHVLQLIPGATADLLSEIFVWLSVITILWSSLVALNQKYVKRLIAYGAVAHSGFLFPMVLMGEGYMNAFLYYAVVYAIMNVAVFYFIQLHGRADLLRLRDTSGLGLEYPVYGALGVIIFAALVGLPPTAGFTAKLFLFSGVWSQYQMTGDTSWFTLLITGIMSSALALFFYMRVPYYYFFLKGRAVKPQIGKKHIFVMGLLAIGLLGLFILPDILNNFVLTTSKP